MDSGTEWVENTGYWRDGVPSWALRSPTWWAHIRNDGPDFAWQVGSETFGDQGIAATLAAAQEQVAAWVRHHGEEHLAGYAGRLVAARFTIDDTDPDGTFAGWHDPARRWNGFARPEFDRDETERIIGWMHRQNALMGNTEYPMTYAWDGPVLVRTATDGASTLIPPNSRDRYPFGDDGLCWFVVED